MKVLTGLVPEWYSPETLDDDDAAEFEVTPLTQRTLAEIQNHFDQEAGHMRPTGFYLAFELGCTNWKGLVDDEGKDVKFSARNKALIPLKVAAEVGAQVIDVSALSEEERKNL
jgi:hypothetical protein